MKRIKIIAFFVFIQCTSSQNVQKTYSKAFVNYKSFKSLVLKIESHREKRLVNFDDFLKISKKDNTIILDTRSAYFYNRRHVKGAINLPFTEFTQQRLRKLIPDATTKILIYCNNNFKDDRINFISKIARPIHKTDTTAQLTLALNIPTYINLYGYGYKSVYELDELLSIFDSRVIFEGSDVLKVIN